MLSSISTSSSGCSGTPKPLFREMPENSGQFRLRGKEHCNAKPKADPGNSGNSFWGSRMGILGWISLADFTPFTQGVDSKPLWNNWFCTLRPLNEGGEPLPSHANLRTGPPGQPGQLGQPGHPTGQTGHRATGPAGPAGPTGPPGQPGHQASRASQASQASRASWATGPATTCPLSWVRGHYISFHAPRTTRPLLKVRVCSWSLILGSRRSLAACSPTRAMRLATPSPRRTSQDWEKTPRFANQSALDRGGQRSTLPCRGARGFFQPSGTEPPKSHLRLGKRGLRQCNKPFDPMPAKVSCALSKALWARPADLTSVLGGLVCNAPKTP